MSPLPAGGTGTDMVLAPRWWRLTVAVAVGTVVAASAVAAIVEGYVRHPTPGSVVAVTLVLAGVGVLLVRRRRPAAVLAVELAITVASTALAQASVHAGAVFLVVVALYSFGTLRPAAPTIVAAVVTGLTIAVVACIDQGNLSPLVPDVALFTAVTAVSFYVRSHRALMVSYRERAEAAEHEQRWTTGRAVAAERVRIARELHDVVAHHVSLLVVQAGAVRETLPPGHVTRPVLDSMIDGGRQAMGELRAMLDALRLDEAGAIGSGGVEAGRTGATGGPGGFTTGAIGPPHGARPPGTTGPGATGPGATGPGTTGPGTTGPGTTGPGTTGPGTTPDRTEGASATEAVRPLSTASSTPWSRPERSGESPAGSGGARGARARGAVGPDGVGGAAAQARSAPLGPQPTCAQIPALVAGAQAAGLPVTLRIDGTAAAVPAGTSLVAYRIVQESLTNALKHAPGAFTTVRLSYGSHELDLSVRNGPAPLLPPPTGDAGSGHGILGMRERAGLARGTITVGPTAEGWEVAARLPLVPASQWDDEAVVDPAPSS